MNSQEIVFILNFITPTINKNCTSEEKRMWSKQRAFYSFGGEYNVENYFSDKNKCKEISIEDYTMENYFSNTDKTVDKKLGGVIKPFCQTHFYTDEEIEEVKRIFKTNKGNIWNGIISFDEIVTKEKIRTKEEVLEFMKRSFNGLLEYSHLNKDNICLYACMHTNTDNNHIHFAFCEKEPIYKSRYSSENIYSYKGKFNEISIENFLLNGLWHLEDDKKNLAIARKNIISSIKDYKNITNILKDNKTVLDDFVNLYKKLPKTGKLAYNSKQMKEHREDINKLADKLISSDERLVKLKNNLNLELRLRKEWIREKIQNNKALYAQNIKISNNLDFELDEINSKDEQNIKMASNEFGLFKIEKLEKDITARIGNAIIKVALNINKTKEVIKDSKKRENIKNAKRYIFLQEEEQKQLKFVARKNIEKIKKDLHKLLSGSINDIKRNFERELEIVRREIDMAEYMKNENLYNLSS